MTVADMQQLEINAVEKLRVTLAAFTPALAAAGVNSVDGDGTAWVNDPADPDGVRPERVEELLGRLLPPEAALDLDFREADIEYMGVVSYEPSSDTVLCSSGGTLRAMSRTECLLESYSDRIRGADNVEDLNEHLEVYLRHGGSMDAVEESVQAVRTEAVEQAVGAVYAAEGPADLAGRLNDLQETLIECELRMHRRAPAELGSILGVGDYVQPDMLPFEAPVRYGMQELRDADLVAVWSDGRAVKDTPDGYRETTVEAELGPRRNTFARAVASALADRTARSTEHGPAAAGPAETPQGRKSGGLKL